MLIFNEVITKDSPRYRKFDIYSDIYLLGIIWGSRKGTYTVSLDSSFSEQDLAEIKDFLHKLNEESPE